jgi:hypothetical protein
MLKADAAPGIDGVTFEEYEQDLAQTLRPPKRFGVIRLI